MRIITGCDRKYLPGVIALWNSIRRHLKQEVNLTCLVHGDEELARDIQSYGIETVLNPDFPPGTLLPIGGVWEVPIPAMYSRLLIPQLFPDEERVLWLDADTLVIARSLKPLEDLDFRGYSLAAHRIPGRSLREQFWGHDNRPVTNLPDSSAFSSGVMLFNVAEWNYRRITERCVEVMNDPPYEMKFVVQSIVNYVLQGEFVPILPSYHVNANRKDLAGKLSDAKILHYVSMIPWDPEDLKNRVAHQKENAKFWEKYR